MFDFKAALGAIGFLDSFLEISTLAGGVQQAHVSA